VSAAKKGQKLKEVTKDFMLRVRMDEETLNRLDQMCVETGLSRSEVVRKIIDTNSDRGKE
jgi:predicted DNA-binding protein